LRASPLAAATFLRRPLILRIRSCLDRTFDNDPRPIAPNVGQIGRAIVSAMSVDSDLAAAWTRLSGAIERLPELLTDAPEPERAEGYRYLSRVLAAGIRVCMEHDDTVTPDLTRSVEHRMTWGLDNPDCTYRYTRLDGAGVYRITGSPGTARHLELQVNTGHQGDGDVGGWKAVSSLTGDDVTLGPDGTVDIILSATPPSVLASESARFWRHRLARTGRGPGAEPDWMALDDTASFLLVREYASDWENEQPAQLVIERLDTMLPPAPLGDVDVARRLDLLVQWLEVGARCWHQLSTGLRSGEVGDVVPFKPPASASGLKGQAYGMGAWRCAPDEALVIELSPPACRMWGVSLCDRYWQSIDFAHRQSSLNDSQSVALDDGRVVLVVTHDDPSVHNWLDPGGRTEGTLAVRYLFGDSGPPARVTRVARRDLERVLPPGMARITPGDRHDLLARRHRAVANRLRY